MSDISEQISYLEENLSIVDTNRVNVEPESQNDDKYEEKKKRFEMLGLDIDTLGHGKYFRFCTPGHILFRTCSTGENKRSSPRV